MTYSRGRSALIGGLGIALCVLAIIGGFFLIVANNSDISENPIGMFLLFALALLEIPAVIIGRALKLPFENGAAAFLVYDLNLLGYALVVVFWGLVGTAAGVILQTLRSKGDR